MEMILKARLKRARGRMAGNDAKVKVSTRIRKMAMLGIFVPLVFRSFLGNSKVGIPEP